MQTKNKTLINKIFGIHNLKEALIALFWIVFLPLTFYFFHVHIDVIVFSLFNIVFSYAMKYVALTVIDNIKNKANLKSTQLAEQIEREKTIQNAKNSLEKEFENTRRLLHCLLCDHKFKGPLKNDGCPNCRSMCVMYQTEWVNIGKEKPVKEVKKSAREIVVDNKNKKVVHEYKDHQIELHEDNLVRILCNKNEINVFIIEKREDFVQIYKNAINFRIYGLKAKELNLGQGLRAQPYMDNNYYAFAKNLDFRQWLVTIFDENDKTVEKIYSPMDFKTLDNIFAQDVKEGNIATIFSNIKQSNKKELIPYGELLVSVHNQSGNYNAYATQITTIKWRVTIWHENNGIFTGYEQTTFFEDKPGLKSVVFCNIQNRDFLRYTKIDTQR